MRAAVGLVRRKEERGPGREARWVGSVSCSRNSGAFTFICSVKMEVDGPKVKNGEALSRCNEKPWPARDLASAPRAQRSAIPARLSRVDGKPLTASSGA